MRHLIRALTLISALLLIAVYFFPLWGISLFAPQYPEGLSLEIWINRIVGDVRNINVLNHYIGMQKIEPERIPELRAFPLMFGILIGSGLIAVLVNRMRVFKLWAALLITCALWGLYDFYAWEYRYGHEISDDAPMKLEESYQPPLIGTKQLANITATSWPKQGGYAFSLSALLALIVLFLPTGRARSRDALKMISMLTCLALGSCSGADGPETIFLGQDQCDTCRMQIVDGRFGGELVTQKGKVYKFDSFDCMQRHYRQRQEQVARTFVFDFENPGVLIDAERATFFNADKLRSPMGDPIVAFQQGQSAKAAAIGASGPGRSWRDMLSNR